MGGLSPPVRGKPRRCMFRGRATKVYPRPCGGNNITTGDRFIFKGLSPPVRGKLPIALICIFGSIPARAGETSSAALSYTSFEVYPRPCGGNAPLLHSDSSAQGLSPPVRGKHPAPKAASTDSGSIPARAGETSRQPTQRLYEVYPRPCGGNRKSEYVLLIRVYPRPSRGLSPPVRGKHPRFEAQLARGLSPPVRGSPTRVYPRPCGGNIAGRSIPARAGEKAAIPARHLCGHGLSPPVRGKHWHGKSNGPIRGSIPARAGET